MTVISVINIFSGGGYNGFLVEAEVKSAPGAFFG